MALGCSLKRMCNQEYLEDFIASHYLFNKGRSIERIYKYMRAIEIDKSPALDVQTQVQFPLVPLDYNPRFVCPITIPLGGSTANQPYFGYYRELFDDEEERPVPTWKV